MGERLMLSLALKTPVLVARGVCLSLLVVAAQPLFAASAEEPIQKSQHRWVSEAEELVGKLRDQARDIPEMEKPDLADEQEVIRWLSSMLVGKQRINIVTADRILWQLWLTTGMPPLLRGPDESLPASLKRNASAYREYVAKHANLTEEELHRLGLTNAVDSFGSPLWYMTMEYLTKKASLKFECIVQIHVTPKRCLIEAPLTADSYTRLSAALSSWLKANEERMIWDSRVRRFHPRDGRYVGTGELSDPILTARIGGIWTEQKRQPRKSDVPIQRPSE
jgi:hypothetical protein